MMIFMKKTIYASSMNSEIGIYITIYKLEDLFIPAFFFKAVRSHMTICTLLGFP